MNRVFLGLGSNLGNRDERLRTALSEIKKRIGNIISVSAFYETPPWGFCSEHPFLNAAAEILTPLTPEALLQQTQFIERQLGRIQKSDGTYHDRPIDIDILFYNREIIKSDRLVIPHPLLEQRRFVLAPLAEIAPEFRHPVSNKTIRRLLDEQP